MIEKLNKDEEELAESLSDPICLIECLFSDLDNNNLSAFDEEKFSEVRLGQKSMVSYEYCLDYDNMKLTTKQKFKQREGTGNVFCYGARRFGKTMIVESLDLILDLILMEGDNVGFSSYDAIHIEGVLEGVIQAFENHPFLRIFDARIKRNPYLISLRKNGSRVVGINMNLGGENPGGQFFQKHLSKLYIEEASQEIQEVYEKRLDSVSENGCVFRISGMTDFIKYSPPGKIFYDQVNQPWIVNYPQFVNPKWDEREKEKAIKEHGGESSISYRMFVKGEIVEDKNSAIDMERVRANYNENKIIKNFEITKENLFDFQNVIIIERPKNAEVIYIAADIGEVASSEIIIISKVNETYHYLYNITLYNLTDKEQFNIFKYIIWQMEANYIALDTTDGQARAIYRALEEIFPKENLIWCFTPDTDILTNNGWKRFYELDKKDKVLTLDPIKNESFYTDIVNFYERDFDGELISYQGERLKFRVTPEHNMWLRPHTMTNKSKFIEAKNIKGNESVKRDIGCFKGKTIKEFIIKGIKFNKKETIKFEIIPFLKFLGWYLSEGCVSPENGINISQSEKVNLFKYNEIIEVIKSLGLHYYKNKDCIGLNNKLLATWLRKECYITKNCKIKVKTIYNCYNKKVPNFIRFLSPELIKVFIDEIWKGDGCIAVSSKQEGYKTSSIKLADDIQELILKTGKNATVVKSADSQDNVYAKSLNKFFKHTEENYKVLKCRNKNSTIKTYNLKKEFYKGKVYDVEVKPHHLIYVRVSGKSFWSGNCGFNEKIQIDVLRDDQGNVIMKDGNIVYKEEMVAAWSVKRLKDLLYEKGKVNLPIDHKLDTQLNSVISIQSGNKTLYECISKSNGDHLFAAWRVFAIAEWKNYMTTTNSIKRKTFSKIGC